MRTSLTPGFVGLPIGIGRKGAPAWRFGPTWHPAAAIRSPPGSRFGVRAEQRPGGHRPPADPRLGLRRRFGEHDLLDEQRLAPIKGERDAHAPQPRRPGDRWNGPDLGSTGHGVRNDRFSADGQQLLGGIRVALAVADPITVGGRWLGPARRNGGRRTTAASVRACPPSSAESQTVSRATRGAPA